MEILFGLTNMSEQITDAIFFSEMKRKGEHFLESCSINTSADTNRLFFAIPSLIISKRIFSGSMSPKGTWHINEEPENDFFQFYYLTHR